MASQVSGFRMWPKDGVTAQLGQQVTLRCEVLPRAQQGCSWLFQRPEPRSSPVFLMYIPSTTNAQAKLAEDLNPTQISGKKVSDTCFLTLHKFRKEEEGYYFCFVMNNYKIYFSPFVPVFTPGLRMWGCGRTALALSTRRLCVRVPWMGRVLKVPPMLQPDGNSKEPSVWVRVGWGVGLTELVTGVL